MKHLPIIISLCAVLLLSGCGASQEELDAQYEAGKKAGYQEGHADGHREAYSEYLENPNEDIEYWRNQYYEALNNQPSNNYDEGFDDGFDEGYSEGHTDGYNEGYEDAANYYR